MIEISKREEFYQQEYCGCAYSLRDSNRYRRKVGRKPIKIGVKYYGRQQGDESPTSHPKSKVESRKSEG